MEDWDFQDVADAAALSVGERSPATVPRRCMEGELGSPGDRVLGLPLPVPGLPPGRRMAADAPKLILRVKGETGAVREVEE